eukprot:SAG31_NODE_14010_length_832_cov_0.929059_2_plen_30_part_01
MEGVEPLPQYHALVYAMQGPRDGVLHLPLR